MSYYRIFSKIYEKGAQKMCRECRGFIEKDDKILDLGCGSGIVAKNFQDFFEAKVLGVDIKDNRIFPIPFQIIDGKSLPFKDLSFDIVLISYVLHHTREPVALLREAKRVAKKIIIYEDLPEGFFSQLRCVFHQAGYNLFFEKERYKFNFKTEKEWEEIFKELELKVIAKKRTCSPLYWLDPGKAILFILQRL